MCDFPIANTALLKNMIVNESMQAMRKPGLHFQTVQQQDLHVHVHCKVGY